MHFGQMPVLRCRTIQPTSLNLFLCQLMFLMLFLTVSVRSFKELTWLLEPTKHIRDVQAFSILPFVIGSFCYSFSYHDGCQGFAGTLRVPWPVSGVCRYAPGTLTGVRGLQVLSGYPGRCQGLQVLSGYPDRCQGFAGTLRVPWPVSGVRKDYPIYRRPWLSVSAWPLNQRRPSHRERNSMGRPPLVNIRIWIWRGWCKIWSFSPYPSSSTLSTKLSAHTTQGPVRYPLSYPLTLPKAQYAIH